MKTGSPYSAKVTTPPVRGRGSSGTPTGRFEPITYRPIEEDGTEKERVIHPTEFFKDRTKSIITRNLSPDVFFNASINPYRGCEHGCSYCYARPTHEYLALSAGLDFETKIFIKENAPELLAKELASDRWVPQVLGMSGITDCYQPIERELGVTRGCLKVLADFRNPVGIITKNSLITRDLDLLCRLNRHQAVTVYLSLTTLDEDLRQKMEPRTSTARKRLEAIRKLSSEGIPCGVMLGPVIPGLTDSEIPALLGEAVRAGARFASYILLRLPHGISDLFQSWLQDCFPDRANKVMHHIREVRGGRLNDPDFRTRMRGEGAYAEQLAALFRIQCGRLKMNVDRPALSTESFRIPGPVQKTLF